MFFRGNRVPALIAMKATGLQPLVLEAKEGLALLNGTQAMVAAGGLALLRGLRVAKLFDLAGAMSLEALMGTPTPFDERIHQARPHAGRWRRRGICANCWRKARFASRTDTTIHGCRMLIACAAYRRCTGGARCA